MRRIASATLLILLLPTLCSGANISIYETPRPVHLGNQNVTEWGEYFREQGLTWSDKFYLDGSYQEVFIEFRDFAVDLEDPVLINNLTIGSMCVGPQEWAGCNVTIPLQYLHIGKNEIRVNSAYTQMLNDWDDFVFTVRIWAKYGSLEPKVIAVKTQTRYAAPQGEQFNVTITATNVGQRPAFNFTMRDEKLNGAYLVTGGLERNFSPLRGGDIIVLRYTLTHPNTGKYASNPGKTRYFNWNSTEYIGFIAPTELRVTLPPPHLLAEKNVTPETTAIGSIALVNLTLFNNGTTSAYNVEVKDYVPQRYNVTHGSSNATFDSIAPGQIAIMEYEVTPLAEGQYFTRADVTFQDNEGVLYNTSSNYVNFRAVRVMPVVSGSTGILLALGLLMMFLALIYMRLR